MRNRAAIRRVFLQPDREATRQAFRHAADQLRPRRPKLAAVMDEGEHDVPAYPGSPAQHRAGLHATDPLERSNREVERRADVVGISPNEAPILRLIGAAGWFAVEALAAGRVALFPDGLLDLLPGMSVG